MDASLHGERDPSALPPGTVIAERYEIVALLGEGGMGSVSSAHDRELDELVALKILHPSVTAADGALEAFRREVKLARRVTHRNVARTYELGEDRQRHRRLLTMELTRGESLGNLLTRRGRLPAPEAIAILSSVCDALAAAHDAGVVHRDVKPDNVLLEETGRVVVTDFGIAREHDPVSVRQTQQVAGTPLYMAPEQIEGAPPTPRTDLYALGVMAFEMLVGEPPWTGASVPAVIVRRLTEAPPDARERLPEIPPSLSAVVRRCMARAPSERFSDAAAVRVALSGGAHVEERRSVPPPPAVAPARLRTLAVLAFKHGGDADDAYLADGVVDELSDALATSRGLRVLSRSALPQADAGEDSRDVGKRLGVAHFVEGQFRRDGDMCRITVKLVEVETGFVAWAQRFELTRARVLSAQDEIARAVTTALGVDGAAARQMPTDATAIDLYLRARKKYHSFQLDEMRESVALLEEAVARSPTNALLHAALSLACFRRYASGDAGQQLGERGARAADEAIRLAPDLGEAHHARAQILLAGGEPSQAARSARVALRYAPSLAEAHELLGRLLLEAGRPEDALRRFDVADQIDPDLIHVAWERARLAAIQGDWALHKSVLDHWYERNPGSQRLIYEVRYASWRRDRAALLKADRDLTASEARLGGPMTFAIRSMLDVFLERDGAAKQFATLEDRFTFDDALRPRLKQWSLQLLAEVKGFIGDGPACARALLEVSKCGLFDRLWLEHCPLLEPARGEPDYSKARDEVRARADEIVDAVWG